jgi:hypothetical protein
MIDSDEAARKELLEESDHWIPTFARKQIGDDLQAASNIPWNGRT